MEASPILYLYNNRIVPEEEVIISPKDRGYYFGDGLYEVFRIYNGRLFEKEAHLARLQRTAQDLRIPIPATMEELSGQLDQLTAESGTQAGILYIQITRGAALRVHSFPPEGTKPVVMAYCQELDRPMEQLEKGIKAVTGDDIRWLRCDLKTLNLLPNVLAKQSAIDRGADEIIFHRSGIITECSSNNVMMVKDGVVHTHPANHLILHGITRAVVLRLLQEQGIPVRETPFTLKELGEADEVFITGTVSEVTPVIEIDGIRVGEGTPGPITRKIQQAFEAAICELHV